MATQWIAGTTAGQVLTAATLNTIGAASESFTPTWSSTGTAPVLNNGTLTGRYFRFNKLVIAQISWTAGSTTTFGTGSYRFSLPITANNTLYTAGYGTYGDASTLNTYVSSVSFVSTTTVQVVTNVNGLNSVWGQATPVAMAVSDTCQITVIYEAA
jgi:transcription elongation factor